MQSQARYGRVISVRLDKDTESIIQKLRENNVNVSALLRRALREYWSTQYSGRGQSQPSPLTVVIERDAYFNNVCRELINTYNPQEVHRFRIDTAYINAIHLMYKICKQAFSQPQAGVRGEAGS
jgi:hypothetical protein